MAELTDTALKYLDIDFILAAVIGGVISAVAVYYLTQYKIIP